MRLSSYIRECKQKYISLNVNITGEVLGVLQLCSAQACALQSKGLSRGAQNYTSVCSSTGMVHALGSHPYNIQHYNLLPAGLRKPQSAR